MPAGRAVSAGGMARIAASAATDTANVATSIEYVIGNPNAAIERPANDGPAIAAVVPRSDASAETAASSSRATSFCVMASSAGR